MTLKELSAVALRGTARAELPKLQGSPLADALARLQTTNAEAALLSRAALAGLYARAGAPLLVAESAPPETLPPASNPLPEKLWPLLLSLLDTAAQLMTLDEIKARGWTLSAAQVLTLLDKNAAAHDLWPLLDERGQAVLETHPIQAAWQKAEAEARWQALLELLRETRLSDPATGAAQTFTLWQEVKADKRGELLDLIEGGLLPEDLPLLQHAEKDRSSEVQKRARLLQGHLPGPLQDELLALLPQAVKNQGGKWKMMPFDLPDALGKVKANDYQDSDHHRLLGALPFALILETLDIQSHALVTAAEKKNWALGAWVKELARNHTRKLVTQRNKNQPQTEKIPAAIPSEQAIQWLTSIQEKGQRDDSTLERFARLLDPAADIPAPQPIPFVLPPAPTMPQAKRIEWEENLQATHLQRQAEAEAAWRTLTEVLRLRREWAQEVKTI